MRTFTPFKEIINWLFFLLNLRASPCRIWWSSSSWDPWRRLQTQHGGTRGATASWYTLTSLVLIRSRCFQMERAKELVRAAIQAGIMDDLGSGNNIDICVITKEGVDYIRPYQESQFKDNRYVPVLHCFQLEGKLQAYFNSPQFIYRISNLKVNQKKIQTTFSRFVVWRSFEDRCQS